MANIMTTDIRTYFSDGCGRCSLGGTPACKVLSWTAELKLLRELVLSAGLTEEVKWGVPCYTLNGKNVCIVSAFKAYASISFFKGALLSDEHNLLQKPGPDSQASRVLKCTMIEEIEDQKEMILALIRNAVEVERAGLTVKFQQNPKPYPDELIQKMEQDIPFKEAFDALTPGRQRGYILHFFKPKRSETRVSRIEKSVANILNGVGLHDKYTSKRR